MLDPGLFRLGREVLVVRRRLGRDRRPVLGAVLRSRPAVIRIRLFCSLLGLWFSDLAFVGRAASRRWSDRHERERCQETQLGKDFHGASEVGSEIRPNCGRFRADATPVARRAAMELHWSLASRFNKIAVGRGCSSMVEL